LTSDGTLRVAFFVVPFGVRMIPPRVSMYLVPGIVF
jgi:hypothetical protein